MKHSEIAESCIALSGTRNAAARKIIRWCVKHMHRRHRRELLAMVTETCIEADEEQTREATLKLLEWTDRMTTLVERGLDAKRKVPPGWWVRLASCSEQVQQLAAWVRADLDAHPTMHEIMLELKRSGTGGRA